MTPSHRGEPLLALESFAASYDAAPVIQGLDLTVRHGETIALMGRNGMGKTTLILGIMGLAPRRGGGKRIGGVEAIALPPEDIARLGVAYIPAGRAIFGSLTVRENLMMAARPRPTGPGWTLDRVLALFPRLAERLGNGGHQLSGGEQQMLAIGRALMTNPRLLLIDEATEGLAPLVAQQIWATLRGICADGMAAVIVDKDVRQLTATTSRAVVLSRGRPVFDGCTAALLQNRDVLERHIGIA